MSYSRDKPLFPKKGVIPTYMVCSKCKREFHSCSVHKCPHEVVRRKVGQNICMYCCRGCEFNEYEGCGQTCRLKANLENKKEKGTPTTT